MLTKLHDEMQGGFALRTVSFTLESTDLLLRTVHSSICWWCTITSCGVLCCATAMKIRLCFGKIHSGQQTKLKLTAHIVVVASEPAAKFQMMWLDRVIWLVQRVSTVNPSVYDSTGDLAQLSTWFVLNWVQFEVNKVGKNAVWTWELVGFDG